MPAPKTLGAPEGPLDLRAPLPLPTIPQVEEQQEHVCTLWLAWGAACTRETCGGYRMHGLGYLAVGGYTLDVLLILAITLPMTLICSLIGVRVPTGVRQL